MRDHENTLENHENQAKIVKNENIGTHRQRLWRPNNCISSDGKHVSKKHRYHIASKRRPSPSNCHQNLTVDQV